LQKILNALNEQNPEMATRSVLTAIHDMFVEATDTDLSQIVTVHGSWLRVFYSDPPVIDTVWNSPYPISEGICGVSAESGTIEVVDDLSDPKWASQYIETIPGMQSALVIPLYTSHVPNEPFAFVNLESSRRGHFSSDKVQVAESLAGIATLLLGNLDIIAYSGAIRSAIKSLSLHDSFETRDDFIHSLASSVKNMVAHTLCWLDIGNLGLCLVDAGSVYIIYSPNDENIGLHYPVNDSIYSSLLSMPIEESVFCISNLSSSNIVNYVLPNSKAPESLIAAPLRHKDGNIFAFLYADASEGDAFGDFSRNLLSRVAERISPIFDFSFKRHFAARDFQSRKASEQLALHGLLAINAQHTTVNHLQRIRRNINNLSSSPSPSTVRAITDSIDETSSFIRTVTDPGALDTTIALSSVEKHLAELPVINYYRNQQPGINYVASIIYDELYRKYSDMHIPSISHVVTELVVNSAKIVYSVYGTNMPDSRVPCVDVCVSIHESTEMTFADIRQPHIRLTVYDNGPGFPENWHSLPVKEPKPRMHVSDRTLARKKYGTGLITIARYLDSLGGAIVPLLSDKADMQGCITAHLPIISPE